MNTSSDPGRALLRHTVATLAYRAEKVVRDVPENYPSLRLSPSSRTPAEILAHIGDLFDWALWLAKGEHRWHDSAPQAWTLEVQRFFKSVKCFDEYLESTAPLNCNPEKLFQGPIADALTHVGQLALIRRAAGAPVRGENYFKAQIVAGRIGAEQSQNRIEFD
jgi:hypothetical protein